MRTWGTELGPGEGCGGPSRLESWSSCCWSLQVTEQVALNQGVEWGGVRGVDSSKPWFVSCAKWVPGLAERWREVTPYAVMAPPVPPALLHTIPSPSSIAQIQSSSWNQKSLLSHWQLGATWSCPSHLWGRQTLPRVHLLFPE